MMEIILPKPTSYQQKVIDWLGDPYKAGKTAVVRSVRQSGKSILCTLLLIKCSLEHKGRSIYICPTLIQCVDMFKRINTMLSDTRLIKATNGMHFSITFCNGSEILFRSMAQGNSLRGLTCQNLLVIDEAAYVTDDQIAEVMPFVNANNASILCCSTPFARQGYFYEVFNLGQAGDNPNVKSFDWSHDPDVGQFLTEERKAFFKKTMSRQMYTTEVLGEFLSDDGMLFTNIQANIIDYKPNADGVYIGIDFGTGNNQDYTVVTVLNKKSEMVDLYKTNNKPPMEQVDWIVNIVNKYPNVVKILAEVNSIGNVYIDAINKKLKRVKVKKWVTSNSSKKEIIQNLQIAFDQETIKIQNDEQLLNELNAFEMNINPRTGTITYAGKKGFHDDTVMSLAIAYHAIHSNKGTYAVSF